MASELVKEVEEAEILMADVHCCGVGLLTKEDIFKLQATLQRAREALRWIPVTERLPKIPKEWEVTVEDDDGNRWVSLSTYEPYAHIKYKWEYESYHSHTRIVAWREKPAPYTPEEK